MKVGLEELRKQRLIAYSLCLKHQYKEAETLLRWICQMEEKVQYPDKTEAIMAIDWLAQCIFYQNRYAEAETLFRESLQRHDAPSSAP